MKDYNDYNMNLETDIHKKTIIFKIILIEIIYEIRRSEYLYFIHQNKLDSKIQYMSIHQNFLFMARP